jgi:hypothetical protein
MTQPRRQPAKLHDELKECCGTCKYCEEDSDGAYCFVDPPFALEDGSYGRGKGTRHEAPPCHLFILKRKLMS